MSTYNKHFSHSRGLQVRIAAVFSVLLVILSFKVSAEESLFDSLPQSRHLAAALSDPASRVDSLMTMAVVAWLLQDVPVLVGTDSDDLVVRFRIDRAWLDRLAARYPDGSLRTTVLDASAWFLLIELDQHQLSPDLSVSPIGPQTDELIHQVFDRSDARLAAAFLPELLMRMEPLATGLWQRLRLRADEDETFRSLLAALNLEHFDRWMAAEPPAPAGQELIGMIIHQAVEDFQILAASSMREEAPDTLRLKRLRFELLSSLPDMEPTQVRDAAYLLRLVSAIDGLQDRKYLAFTETLLWLISDLLLSWPVAAEPDITPVGDVLQDEEPDLTIAVEDQALSDGELATEGQSVADGEFPAAGQPGPGGELVAEDQPETGSASEEDLVDLAEPVPDVVPSYYLPRILAEMLPQLSHHFARDFSDVDPRINASLAAAYDVAQSLHDGFPIESERLTQLKMELGDAVAQFVLMIPDMNFYFDQPVRSRITEEINVCTSIAAATDADGKATLSREQFDRCLASMVDLSDSLVRSAELSGDTDGPYGTDQLERELELTPWQRINYALGYLHETGTGMCEQADDPLPNPLEWSTLATVMSWFARQSPVYFQTPENEALIVSMKQQGMELLQAMEQQVDCFSSEGPGISDPVSRGLVDYRLALDDLIAGIRETELAFRTEALAAGADIVLSGDANQNTAYRPDGLIIGPCRPDHVCEMTSELEATRALIGLFPEQYLIADQIGLGKIEICYDNMQWVQRRAEPVRADDPQVANYYGRLSFDLIGRYTEEGTRFEVFGSNFVSPDEHHYLFAAASAEVLDDSCPTEWVGSKIVTGLGNELGKRVVPDRLTYLAAARSLPSRIINLNWNRGAEWRDWFVTGLGITKFEFELDQTIPGRIGGRLRALHQAEQAAIYSALLQSPSRSIASESASLHRETSAVSAAKALVRTQMSLFYADILLDSDDIRSSLEGTHALIDGPVLSRFRDGNVAVESINELGISRFEDFRSRWRRQPEAVRRSGSTAVTVAHAIARLNSLYLEFFEPLER